MHYRVLEGTWSEVSIEAGKLSGDEHVRLEVLEPAANGTMIRHGMFKALGEVTEADFRAAKWREPSGDEF